MTFGTARPQTATRPEVRRPIRSLADIEAIEAQRYDDVVPVHNTHQLLQRSAALFPEHTALTYLTDGSLDSDVTTLTFSDLLADVNRAANALRRLGLKPDETVALLMPSMPEAFVSLFAAQAAGRVCPINYMLAPEHIAHLLDSVNATVLVALGPDAELDIWSKLSAIRQRSRSLRAVVCVGDAPEPWAHSFAALIAAESPVLSFDVTATRDSIASFFHTGGTTGVPKLVTHTHGNEVHVSWFGGMFYDMGDGDVIINGFPLFHVAGAFVLGGSAIAAGAATLIPSKLGMRNKAFVRDFWPITRRFGVTFLSGGPTFVSTILNRPVGEIDISGVKALFGGGSPMPVETAARFETAFNVPLRSIYGMTEASGLASVIPRAAQRVPGASGWRLPFCEVAVFALNDEGEPDPQSTLPPGVMGALALRGPNISPGYTDPSVTAAAFTAQGWLLTGDMGQVAEDGQIVVMGRSKDVIIRSGHNIDPAVIEEALMQHPDVQLCAAVGQPDAYAGELPVAFVQVRPSRTITAQQILEATRGHIPEPAAVPKALYLIDALPLTTTGKIFKPALRRMAVERAFSQQLTALLPDGALESVTCLEEKGARRVEIRLAGDAAPGSEATVAQHMAGFAVPYALVSD
ncbi:AMP-binding protein [Pararhodobacter zhoushanensis]|uniref:AMP-binding protein n=1 Tax=Pararhodobacter zhoushanensis TaxID=2479545 RepID=UPI000F8E29E2|nr:AMP-binding protein [Pararhodobacter zhoushanensis]